MSRGVIRIGCASWAIPAGVRDRFGAGDSVLARYASVFDAVEINSSFYRSHRPATYARWATAVPATFRFSVKMPRAITHEARLKGCGDLLDRFVDEIAGLDGTLGGVLVQLPPSLAFERRVAATFFDMLRRRHGGAVALEPRHRSWFDAPVDAFLRDRGVARVAADPARVAGAESPGGDQRWHYWRWHGAQRMYYSAYDDAALQHRANEVQAATGERWCIFDNTALGHATSDAFRLRELILPSSAPATRQR